MKKDVLKGEFVLTKFVVNIDIYSLEYSSRQISIKANSPFISRTISLVWGLLSVESYMYQYRG